MNINFWGNVIAKDDVSGDFRIVADIATEADYSRQVIFNDH